MFLLLFLVYYINKIKERRTIVTIYCVSVCPVVWPFRSSNAEKDLLSFESFRINVLNVHWDWDRIVGYFDCFHIQWIGHIKINTRTIVEWNFRHFSHAEHFYVYICDFWKWKLISVVFTWILPQFSTIQKTDQHKNHNIIEGNHCCFLWRSLVCTQISSMWHLRKIEKK